VLLVAYTRKPGGNNCSGRGAGNDVEEVNEMSSIGGIRDTLSNKPIKFVENERGYDTARATAINAQYRNWSLGISHCAEGRQFGGGPFVSFNNNKRSPRFIGRRSSSLRTPR
jgi:hypothetical protein